MLGLFRNFEPEELTDMDQYCNSRVWTKEAREAFENVELNEWVDRVLEEAWAKQLLEECAA